MRKVIGLVGVAAALTYFFDPDSGKRRRAMARDRFLAFFRHRGRELGRAGRLAQAEAYGAKQKVKHLSEQDKPQPDDVTLAHKVETEIFRDADIPKGQINVNAEDGVVVLRGEVERPEMIKDLEDKTRKVKGVREVENLLHLPGTEAPMHSAH